MYSNSKKELDAAVCFLAEVSGFVIRSFIAKHCIFLCSREINFVQGTLFLAFVQLLVKLDNI